MEELEIIKVLLVYILIGWCGYLGLYITHVCTRNSDTIKCLRGNCAKNTITKKHSTNYNGWLAIIHSLPYSYNQIHQQMHLRGLQSVNEFYKILHISVSRHHPQGISNTKE